MQLYLLLKQRVCMVSDDMVQDGSMPEHLSLRPNMQEVCISLHSWQHMIQVLSLLKISQGGGDKRGLSAIEQDIAATGYE